MRRNSEGLIMTRSSLTVFFENPFWIGLYERMDDGKYEVCKITFGAEPKDYEIYEYMLQNWKNLKFSPPIKGKEIEERRINPKRPQREINKQLDNTGIGTKAQQALQLQHEQDKKERKIKTREQKEAEKDRQFAIKQEKRKAKHRGR